MIIELTLEELMGGAKTAKVTKVNYQSGDVVEAGEIVAEIEANKTTTPIKSKANGTIKDILVKEGDSINIGEIIGTIEGEVVQENNFNYFSNLLKPTKKEIQCDIAIIGGGPGGYVAAIEAAKLGAKVVLVEKDSLGGTCLNWGCIPTKALVKSAQMYKNIQEAEEFDCSADHVKVNIQKVIDRKDNIVLQLKQGVAHLLQKHGVTVVEGMGELQDAHTIYIKNGMTETTIRSKDTVIATGSKVSTLPIEGSDHPNVLDSKKIMEIQNLPKKLAIIGGGVIGMEFAFIFAAFGVEVSVIEYFDQALISCDTDICDVISQEAKKKGIQIFTHSKVDKIIDTEDGESVISFIQEDKQKYITADKVLMAVGREPNLEGIQTKELGIKLNKNNRGIEVSEKLQTNIEHIYAIGDVTDKMQLAHVASHQGIIAVHNILGEDMKMDYSAVPSAIFTDPEIGVVGICEKGAKDQGIEIEVGKFPFAASGKAMTLGETVGFVKIIKEKETGKVIGGSIIGPHASDLIAQITLAMQHGLTTKQIIETIHAHPTTAEAIYEAAMDVEGGSIHFAK